MKKFSIFLNSEENSLIASITKNGELILEDLPELDTYAYVGTLFNSFSKLNRKKPIKIIFNLKTMPFVFILLILKIKSNTGIDISIYLKDENTYNFIQDFLNADPDLTKSFFTKNSSNLSKNNYESVFKETDSETGCELNIRKKFQEVRKELDKNEEIIKNNIYLKDTEDIKHENEEMERYLEIIKNASNDNFTDDVENNLVKELRKLNIKLI